MECNVTQKTETKVTTLSRLSSSEGWIFDIKRFAIHDGPGIRTTIFLKGCSLQCVWCHNPEGISPKLELMLHPEKCIACGACLKVCPNGAHQVTVTGERTYDRNLCQLCGRCVESCYTGALMMAGKRVSVDDVMAVVREDITFYESSGGGITLSGGEPLLQDKFTTAILQQCKAEGFHTAIDTCGHIGWRVMQKALPFVDLVLYDIKHISPLQHQRYTGATNRLILANLHRLCDFGVPIEIRMVIIPTINDSRELIESTAQLLGSLHNITAVRLLAYHRLAGSKYDSLGKENNMPEVASPSQRRMRQIATWISCFGLNVIVPPAGAGSPGRGDSQCM